jgi:hypothetical protein
MANENMIKFLRGNVADLPQTATAGALYFTKDEGVYLGLENGSYHRYGDFITVADVNSLPATGAHATCMYYCTSENILARYDSVKGWIQINKQPTAEEMKTLLGLGSLAYLSEVAEDNLSSALKEKVNAAAEGNHAHLNKDELDKIADGDVEKWNTAYTHSQADHAPVGAQANIIESVKVNGEALTITDKAVDITVPTGALADKDEVAKADLAEALATEIDNKVASVGAGDASVTIGGTATAPTVAAKISAAEGNALTLAEDGLKVIIPESTKVEASETNGNIKVDGEEVTVYTHPEKHAIADVDGLQGALDAINDEETGVLAQAKAYVDDEDVFETDMATINALGGIAAGADLNGLTTHEVLKKLLYPYVDATVGNATATPNGGTYEKGATKTITQVSISITKKSEPITSVALYNGSTLIEEKTGDAVKNGGTITFSGLSVEVPTNGNQLTVKVTYPDANGNAKTVEKKTTALTFVYPYYMGTCAAGTAVDETLVESLTKKIEGKGNKSNSFTVSDGHMVFAYPKAHGVLKSILDPNNFETIGNYTRSEVSVTGLDGTAQTYYVYVSGATTVSGFTVNFKY